MFLSKKGAFSQELALKALQKLLQEIKLAAESFNSPDQVLDAEYENLKTRLEESGKRLHIPRPDEMLTLPLDDLLNRTQDY